MRMRKVSELITDFALYPRTAVDGTHVRNMRETLAAGGSLPPIIICAKTLRIADGVHRCRALMSHFGPDHLVEVVERRYKSDKDFLLDSIRLNASHGRSLTRCDRTRCLILGEQAGLSLDAVAQAMSMTPKTLGTLQINRIALTMDTGKTIPLKQTIRHKSGQPLTEAQVHVNDKLGGMSALFYTNQLIMLIEHDLLDTSNGDLMKALGHLASLIAGLPAVVP